MLVVSNIDLKGGLRTMKPSKFLESSIKDSVLNVNNDYRYMKTGYYVSLHAEVLGNPVIPSSENVIDANRTPILLLRAARAGIPTLTFLVTDSVKKISEHGFPVAVFAINPFIYRGFKIARNRSALYRAVKSLSMNYKFAVCTQPLKGEMLSIKSFFGKPEIEDEKVQVLSRRVYELFKIPICLLHVQKVEEKAYLSGLQTLRKEELTPNDLRKISRQVSLLLEQGENFSG